MIALEDAILVDLNDYELVGGGFSGESYNHRKDSSVMLKLNVREYPVELILNDLQYSWNVYNAGIPSPKPGELVTDGHGRYGIRFERIPNKISFAKAVGTHPERVEEYARDFARQCLKAHSIHVDTSVFRSVKDHYLEMLEANPYFTPEEKVKVAAFIRNAPDSDVFHHGDLQFGNVVMSDDRRLFIDVGDAAYGHPYFDLGQVLLTCVYDEPDFLQEVFHMDKPTAAEFWKWFCKEYFSEDCDPDEMDRLIRPYAGLMVLIIERNANMHYPQYHALLSGVTG